MTQHYVYALHDGVSSFPFYVGVTQHPRRRLSAHKAAADGRRKDSLTGCGIKGKDISMRILCSSDERHVAELIESCMIEHYKIVIINRKQIYKGHTP